MLLAAHVSTNVRRAQSLRATSILSTPTFALTAVHAQMFALLAQSLRANNPTKNNKKRRVSRGSPFFVPKPCIPLPRPDSSNKPQHWQPTRPPTASPSKSLTSSCNPSLPKSGKHSLPHFACHTHLARQFLSAASCLATSCLPPSRARTFIIYMPTAPPLELFQTSALVFFQCRGHVRALWQKLLFVKIHQTYIHLFFSLLHLPRT